MLLAQLISPPRQAHPRRHTPSTYLRRWLSILVRFSRTRSKQILEEYTLLMRPRNAMTDAGHGSKNGASAVWCEVKFQNGNLK